MAAELWLAMGVIVTKHAPPFRRQTEGLLGMEWRYVSTRSDHRRDPQYVVVPCTDFFESNASRVPKTAMGFQFSCFCKTAHWFRRALTLFPSARFIGKMEDDSVLFDARVLAELMSAAQLARREPPRRPRALAPMLWYGHFDWAMHMSGDLAHAKFCSVGDNAMLVSAPSCARGVGVLALFANGGLDIRSRALAERAAACDLVWAYIDRFNSSNASYLASCDGLQGFFMARCFADELNATQKPAQQRARSRGAPAASAPVWILTALHLPWPKYHPPSRGIGARMHSSLIHPDKRCTSKASWYANTRRIMRGMP
ncbi:hypothetical protein AB1Y20_003389 [Prymnesium parvum]|uniref:Hexosyltransferase n=1 Tax=Prymnesium parvum TaxID=97485 RepID=A0AB34JBW0_PRYPA